VAEKYDRTLDYGLRVHVIVRDTEPRRGSMPSTSSPSSTTSYGTLIRERALDSGSLGVSHQARARELADQFGYVEPHLWTGIGRARSGCGAALVGSADQVLSEIEEYRRWASAPSSSRATRIWTNAGISAASSCRS
jgi:alkanesulfonate monooxygenase